MINVVSGPLHSARTRWYGFFAAPAYLAVMHDNIKAAILFHADSPVCNLQVRHDARCSDAMGQAAHARH
jgi:hypothetical protein